MNGKSASENFISYLLSENVFVSLSFLKDIFAEHGIQSWQFFSFIIWKMYHFLPALMISDEKFTIIWISVPLQVMLFFLSLAAFKIFSLSLVFRSYLWCVLCGYFLVFLFGFHRASWICRFMGFAKFGTFSAIISLNSFSVPLSPLL